MSIFAYLYIYIYIDVYINLFCLSWKIAQIQMRYVVWILNDNNFKKKHVAQLITSKQQHQRTQFAWTIKILYRIYVGRMSEQAHAHATYNRHRALNTMQTHKRDNLYLNA